MKQNSEDDKINEQVVLHEVQHQNWEVWTVDLRLMNLGLGRNFKLVYGI